MQKEVKVKIVWGLSSTRQISNNVQIWVRFRESNTRHITTNDSRMIKSTYSMSRNASS